MKSISVICPSYNAEKYIGDAILSLNKQTHPPKEFILIDDASTDNTLRKVRSLQKQTTLNFRIKTIPIFANKGAAHARNIGIAHAKSDLLFFLDADDCLAPTALEEATKDLEAKANLDVSIIGSWSAWIETDKHGTPTGNLLGSPPNVLKPSELLIELLSREFLTTTGGLFLRNEIEQVKGFDESFKTAQDVEILFRLAESGKGISVANRPYYFYRRHGENSTNNLYDNRAYFSQRMRSRYNNAEEIKALLTTNKHKSCESLIKFYLATNFLEINPDFNQLADEIESSCPTTQKSLFYSAVCRAVSGDILTAKESFDRILKENPRHPEALNNLAYCQLSLGNLKEAEENLRLAIFFAPNYLDASENLNKANNKQEIVLTRRIMRNMKYF